ncbi:MAG: hypothetical protein HC857_01125 [Synechococcales cyanobacterium RU_4_20]|nr:hypothetical protein [Synechococcales cyanobacterium RU_4_20]
MINVAYLQRQLARYRSAIHPNDRQDAAYRLLTQMAMEVSVLASVSEELDAIDSYVESDFDEATLQAIATAAQNALGVTA